MKHWKQKTARANVSPVRQRTQFSCMAAAMAMALRSLGINCTEDEAADVMGVRPMRGATWEDALAAAQHYGCRATLCVPATISQIKEWTDAGDPVLIAWNPEGREWSHASVVFDVTDDQTVHVADPNIPDPDETVRMVPRRDFYSKWSEKWPRYLVRRPAMRITREITEDGRQVMASKNPTQEYPIGFQYGEDFEVVTFNPTHPIFPGGVYGVSKGGDKRNLFLHPAPEMKEEVEWEEKAWASNRLYRQKAEEARREKNRLKEEKKSRLEDTKGFADQFSPMRRARILKTLNMTRSIQRKAVTLREWIPKKIKEGWTVRNDRTFKLIFENRDGDFYTQKDLTATGLAYAEYLLSHKNRLARSKQADVANNFRKMNTLRQHIDAAKLARVIFLEMAEEEAESFLATMADLHHYPLELGGDRIGMLEKALQHMSVNTLLDEMAREVSSVLLDTLLASVSGDHKIILAGDMFGGSNVKNVPLLGISEFERCLTASPNPRLSLGAYARLMQSKFEKGKEMSAQDVADYLREGGNPEAADDWLKYHEANKDKIKGKKAKFEKGKEMSAEEVAEYLRNGGNPEAAEDWLKYHEANKDKIKGKTKGKKAHFTRQRLTTIASEEAMSDQTNKQARAARITPDLLLKSFRDLSQEDATKLASSLTRAHSPRDVSTALRLADELLDGFGVEEIKSDEAWDNYYGEAAALYVNTGDTYNTTIVYDIAEGSFYLTDWGSWVEHYERQGGRIKAANWNEEPMTVEDWLTWEV